MAPSSGGRACDRSPVFLDVQRSRDMSFECRSCYVRLFNGRFDGDCEFLAMRPLAAFRRLAMRLRACLIGTSMRSGDLVDVVGRGDPVSLAA